MTGIEEGGIKGNGTVEKTKQGMVRKGKVSYITDRYHELSSSNVQSQN